MKMLSRIHAVLLLAMVALALGACGSRSALKDDPFDVVLSDGRVFVDRGPEIPPRVTAICPAPLRGTQTETATLVGRGESNVGLPLTYAWTAERLPDGSTSVPTPADQATTRLLFDTGGEWLLRFTVRDADGREDSCTVRAEAIPAIDLRCPNDQSNYLGSTVPLDATARSRLDRAITLEWTVEARPMGSMTAPVPPTSMNARMTLDQLGDWRLRLTARDTAGLTSSCVTNVHADPDVIVMCPPDLAARPSTEATLVGRGSSRRGLPLTYRWEIVSQPITSTAVLRDETSSTARFTFDVAGNWTYRFTATNPEGNRAFCTTRAIAASDEAVRVEIVWNIDRSCRSCNAQGGGIDIDLHLADGRRGNQSWAERANGSDCYFANCKCPLTGRLCTGNEPGLPEWAPVGVANNPQLDVDHISDLPGPENINVVRAEIGTAFDVGVHYYSGSSDTPVVARVYCGGSVVFESEPVRLSGGSGVDGNDMWLVGRVTTTPGGCDFRRCGAPGMLGDCVRPQERW